MSTIQHFRDTANQTGVLLSEKAKNMIGAVKDLTGNSPEIAEFLDVEAKTILDDVFNAETCRNYDFHSDVAAAIKTAQRKFS